MGNMIYDQTETLLLMVMWHYLITEQIPLVEYILQAHHMLIFDEIYDKLIMINPQQHVI